jgi:phage tail-like protein
MAVQPDNLYGRFNFLVDLGTGSTEGPDAGFQECSAIGSEIAVSEYRNGNDRADDVRKITGLTKAFDVTLRRGIIGSLSLHQWFDEVRNANAGALRNVTIQLQNEDHTAVVMTWKLLRARPVRHLAGPLHARGSEVALEELTLAYERLDSSSAGREPVQRAELPCRDHPPRGGRPAVRRRLRPVRRPGDRSRGAHGPRGRRPRPPAAAARTGLLRAGHAPARHDVVLRPPAPLAELAAPGRGVRFSWGRLRFDGRVEALHETLDAFSPDGRPLRAFCDLVLREEPRASR